MIFCQCMWHRGWWVGGVHSSSSPKNIHKNTSCLSGRHMLACCNRLHLFYFFFYVFLPTLIHINKPLRSPRSCPTKATAPNCPIDFTSNSICWKASDHWRNNYEIWGTNLDMRIVRCYEKTISLHNMFASIYDQSSSLQSPLVRLNHLKPGRWITHDTDTSKNILYIVESLWIL